jgi:pyridoxine 5-phosphate synthase
MKSIFLGINIDHVATVRQLRKTPYPDLIKAVREVELGGADGITIHLREDRRHIQDQDVWDISQHLTTQLNFECAITPAMLAIAVRARPHSVCLVPEKRQEVTTEGGLDVKSNQGQITEAVSQLHEQGIKVSLFIDADIAQVEAAAQTKTDMIEIHTGRYADATPLDQPKERHHIKTAAALAEKLGLQVNAGHGLHLDNVEAIVHIPQIVELNIGHSIVARALFVGLRNAVREMKEKITKSRQNHVEHS